MDQADADGAFRVITATSGLPDFKELANNDMLHEAVLAARDSAGGAAFRQWFHSNLRDSPEDLAAAFHELTASRGIGDLGPVKVVRFVISTLAQAFATYHGGPGAGVAVAAADTFLVNNFLRRDPSPKMFIRDVKGAFGSYSDLAD